MTLPRWTPGEVLLALAVALATAVGLCLSAYAMRAGGGALGVAGALITWPFWWLEAALYAWAGALAALWVVGRRHREQQRRHAVEPGGPAERSFVRRPFPAHPDRDPLLHRDRQQLGVGDPVVAALVAERLAGPQPGQHVQPFVELLGPHPRVRVLTEVGELQAGW